MASTTPVTRFLMTVPYDGHPDTERCPACPHETDQGNQTSTNDGDSVARDTTAGGTDA